MRSCFACAGLSRSTDLISTISRSSTNRSMRNAASKRRLAGKSGTSRSSVPTARSPPCTSCRSSPKGTATPAPTPAPTPAASNGCSLRERQQWAADQLREWYLFPDTLPAAISPASYATVSDYIDALTATARAQRKDRYFTYITSIAEENALLLFP